VQIWDTVGQEKFNQDFIYSQNYIQGKNGVIMVADTTGVNSNPKESIAFLNEKLALLEKNCGCDLPVFLCFFDKTGGSARVEIQKSLINCKNIIETHQNKLHFQIDCAIEKTINSYVHKILLSRSEVIASSILQNKNFRSQATSEKENT